MRHIGIRMSCLDGKYTEQIDSTSSTVQSDIGLPYFNDPCTWPQWHTCFLRWSDIHTFLIGNRSTEELMTLALREYGGKWKRITDPVRCSHAAGKWELRKCWWQSYFSPTGYVIRLAGNRMTRYPRNRGIGQHTRETWLSGPWVQSRSSWWELLVMRATGHMFEIVTKWGVVPSVIRPHSKMNFRLRERSGNDPSRDQSTIRQCFQNYQWSIRGYGVTPYICTVAIGFTFIRLFSRDMPTWIMKSREKEKEKEERKKEKGKIEDKLASSSPPICSFVCMA